MLCFIKFPVAKKFMEKRGWGRASRFSFENSLSHSAEKNHREPFCAVIQKISDSEKVYGKEGGGESIKIFRRKFFVSQCRQMSYGNPSVLCFRKFPVTKKFMDKRGGVSRLSVENSLCHSAEKNHREPFCAVIQKISDSEKVYGKKGRGRVSRFSFESFFCPIMPKSFIGKTFCAVFQKFSGSQKVYGKEGGRVSRFSVESFSSHNADKCHTGTLLCCVSENFR